MTRERAAHGRFSQPGTRMTEKYGATSSRFSFEPHGDRFRRGAALDIDGARQPPGAGEHTAHLFEMAAELHHHGGIGVQQAPLKLGLRQRRGQHDEHVVALRDRRAGQRPAAGHRGDAGHDLGPVARRKTHMQMHVGAIEQRIALADDGDGAAQRRDGARRPRRRCRRNRGSNRDRPVRSSAPRSSLDRAAASSSTPGRKCCATILRALLALPALAKCATTSASASMRAAFSVKSSGSPGPTPTPIRRPFPGSFTVLPSPVR